ncbi:MAG: type II CRISPR RNA-guided endonuclease Cas9 [Candidatus Saccharibacteria bacterium]|nr:type II CRISPR RNA-guided endonuclease Cas9 [Candidatus Saccharibacteria bacterium]
MAKKYYIGLDCGTSSVGWAATDENYKILRAKGKSTWGSRLFDEADTAAERRIARSVRRRNRRAKNRIKLLNQIFSDEIAKIDPDFYIRLRESFFREEDKEGLSKNSKNTLFNDNNFKDKDFHKLYPTIWHLRKAIMEEDKHFDIRLYYLAIHHIIKRRGHFLYDGKMSGAGNFADLYQELADVAGNYGILISEESVDSVEEIIKSKIGKNDKAKQLKNIMFIEGDELEEDSSFMKRAEVLAKMLVGSKITLRAIFEDEVEKDAMKFSFSEGSFEDKETEIIAEIGAEKMDLIEIAKKIYDFSVLNDLLDGNGRISDAMVSNYEKHKSDLKKLKEALKPFEEEYEEFFKTTKTDGKKVCYNAYIGKAYSEDANGRKKFYTVSQEDINKEIVKILEKCDISGELLKKAKEGELLPKQKGQAKGTIPQQLHHNELEMIVEKLAKDYPSFAEKVDCEPEEYNTKAKKILSIHEFRIPYYCGPIVSKRKSQFSWADDEISELVYPWNFKKLVNLNDRADKFIKRMTNACTYLIGEDVLPKSSLLYQKYMVLNELNNLKINGRRIEDIETKKMIYEKAFLGGELAGNITLKSLKRYLVFNNIISEDDELGGTSETKFLPKLSTNRDFIKVLGEDYRQKYSEGQLEKTVELITILSQEKKMLKSKIEEVLGCSEEQATRLSKLNYKDWAKFSKKFLTGIFSKVNGIDNNIIDALYNTNNNLMELLGGEFEFKTKIDEFNENEDKGNKGVTYEDVKNLYCSPAVKRTVWQAIKIIKELVKVEKCPPEKIFLEVARGEDEKNKGYTLSRQKQLQELYKQIKNSSEAIELLSELDSKEPRDLQNKKLYLYFTQMGKCAYTGETIDLERLATNAYDIDHIYPRSRTKDDSILRNLVLVKAEYNREKTDTYPISEEWRKRMYGTWVMWMRNGLITKEKFNRLTRGNPLTDDELGNFIARQIVETGQSVKAIRDLLQKAYPKTKIVLVKAGQVSEFRQWFGYNKTEKGTGRVIRKGKPEFIKVRAINDFHHAKDAYLNIVVGNVMNETFTDDPFKWVKNQGGKRYSLLPKNLWRENVEDYWLDVKGWNYSETIKTVSEQMKRNDCLWTRMNYIESGAISDLMIVGKAEKDDGILPIKAGGKYDPKKYGGYRSLAGAYFSLIECNDKKGNKQRRIVPIPQVYKDKLNEYIAVNYNNGKVIIPVIGYKSLVKINGFPMHISRKGSEVAIGFYHAMQTVFDLETSFYIKKIVRVAEKDQITRGKYEINEEKDKVSFLENEKLLNEFLRKLEAFRKMPELGGKIDEIRAHKADFYRLSLKQQCLTLNNFINVFTCAPTTADLSSFVPKAAGVGKGKFNDDMMKYKTAELINQSVTGLYEKVIDLKRI